MNVVKFKAANLLDIATRLRDMADYIEKREDTQHLTCILVLGDENQEAHVYGWGTRACGLEVQGWLARAAHVVASACSRRLHLDDSA